MPAARQPLTPDAAAAWLGQADFDDFFARHRDGVYRLALYLTRSRDEAEDLFQETWLRAVRQSVAGCRVTNSRAWLFTIALNTRRDSLRRRRLRRLFFLDREAPDPPAGGPDGAGRWQGAELRMALRAAIARLPEEERQTFVLKEIEGLRHVEIAELLNKPVGTVKFLMHRAVKRLQRELAGDGGRSS